MFTARSGTRVGGGALLVRVLAALGVVLGVVVGVPPAQAGSGLPALNISANYFDLKNPVG